MRSHGDAEADATMMVKLRPLTGDEVVAIHDTLIAVYREVFGAPPYREDEAESRRSRRVRRVLNATRRAPGSGVGLPGMTASSSGIRLRYRGRPR